MPWKPSWLEYPQIVLLIFSMHHMPYPYSWFSWRIDIRISWIELRAISLNWSFSAVGLASSLISIFVIVACHTSLLIDLIWPIKAFQWL
jgi:hypothetical protein